jgi:hypothetical protein
VISKISTRQQVHYQIKIVVVVESVVHVDDKVVMESREDLAFIEDGLGATLRNDPCFGHLLKCKELLGALLLHFPDLSKASATNDIDELEHAA